MLSWTEQLQRHIPEAARDANALHSSKRSLNTSSLLSHISSLLTLCGRRSLEQKKQILSLHERICDIVAKQIQSWTREEETTSNQ